jgi:predicted MFS family arabinose efflux permease
LSSALCLSVDDMTRQRAHNSTGVRAWLGLLVVLGPVLLVSMDGSILFLAMPRIGQALTPTAGQALWILDIYGFAVGSLLIAFGNIGDRYGRLRLLMIGATVFGAGSAGAAFAASPELLIAFRALMGVAGATLLPSGLAVLSELFPDQRRRAQAIGIFAAAFAVGFAVGPIVGGTLLERFWWGSVFLINLSVIALFLLFAPTLLREVRATRPARDRIGKRTALIICHFSIAAGLLLMLPTAVTGGIGWYVAATAIAGVGYGISFSVVADTAVAAVPVARAGSAGAIAETSNELGNALGIALLGSLAALIFRLERPGLAPTLDETLQLADLAPSAVEQAKAAFVAGLHATAAVASLLHTALGILALRWLPRSVRVQPSY